MWQGQLRWHFLEIFREIYSEPGMVNGGGVSRPLLPPLIEKKGKRLFIRLSWTPYPISLGKPADISHSPLTPHGRLPLAKPHLEQCFVYLSDRQITRKNKKFRKKFTFRLCINKYFIAIKRWITWSKVDCNINVIYDLSTYNLYTEK